VIAVRAVTKRYGGSTAVEDLSFEVRPGMVAGLLGPNGSGKSTTLRIILGLDHPTSGVATVDGRRYADLPAPARRVGALLDAGAAEGGRRARDHLRWVARAARLPRRRRVDEVLAAVGLAGAADTRVRALSLGMRQRLGIAAALLGDPATLILDEPVNGLDPAGIEWMRRLLERLAAEGRTVLVASHHLAEMQAIAGPLVVIAKGRLLADTTVAELTRGGAVSLSDAFLALTGTQPNHDPRAVAL
jgi:ABC-2 type transport system ATP-binding protein